MNETDTPSETPREEQLAAISLPPAIAQSTQPESPSMNTVGDNAEVPAKIEDARSSLLAIAKRLQENNGGQRAAACPNAQNEGQSVGNGANDAANIKAQAPFEPTTTYLLKHSPEFRRLHDLRKQGWSRPEGDVHFAKQRQQADHANDQTKRFFYAMMQNIGYDMHASTDGALMFDPELTNPAILDMCCAPGGFLSTAMSINPTASAVGLTLPPDRGGHTLLIPESPRLEIKYLDVTMLASDLGFSPDHILPSHPDAPHFLPRLFSPDQYFDLVVCDGQVLRNHERAAYRATQALERRRIMLTQFVVGLEHIKEGGTMVVLLHKLDHADTVRWLCVFERFAEVRLYKHGRYHASRSSFYMVATKVESGKDEAREAVREWKREWGIATFGKDGEYEESSRAAYGGSEEEVLKEFGGKLVEKGRAVWEIQASSLERAPWMSGGKDRQW